MSQDDRINDTERRKCKWHKERGEQQWMGEREHKRGRKQKWIVMKWEWRLLVYVCFLTAMKLQLFISPIFPARLEYLPTVKKNCVFEEVKSCLLQCFNQIIDQSFFFFFIQTLAKEFDCTWKYFMVPHMSILNSAHFFLTLLSHRTLKQLKQDDNVTKKPCHN